MQKCSIKPGTISLYSEESERSQAIIKGLDTNNIANNQSDMSGTQSTSTKTRDVNTFINKLKVS